MEIELNKVYTLIYETKSGYRNLKVEYTFLECGNKKSVKYHVKKTFFKYNGDVDYIKSYGGKDRFDYCLTSKSQMMYILTGKGNKDFDRNHFYNLVESPFMETIIKPVVPKDQP